MGESNTQATNLIGTQNPASKDSGANKLPATVAIINGRPVIKHPPEGPYPVIVPCRGLRLVVNGEERKEPMPVTSKDKIEILPVDEKQEGYWRIKISGDKLAALLQMRPGIILHRCLKDLPPAKVLQLEVLEQESHYPPFTLEDLVRELKSQGIQYGIDWQTCARLVEEPAEGTWTIARGQPAFPGKDATVQLLFTTQDRVPVTIKEEEQQVNFRERFQFTSVEPGTVLARKKPVTGGRPGRAVTGEIILPPEPREIELVAGQGAILSDNGLEVVATRSGRPMARKTKDRVTIEVVPALIHDGNVNLSSGNINFSGDVIVTGQVEEGMAIEAGGNVYVGDTVSRGIIRAGGSIEVAGNIFVSVLAAGGITAFQQRLSPLLARIAEELEQLITAIKQLLRHPSFKKDDLKGGIGPLVLLLMEKKFQGLSPAIELLQKEVQNLQTISLGEPEGLINDLERLTRSPLGVKNLDYLETMLQKVAGWQEGISAPLQGRADVTVNYVVNSTIMASGNIRVLGDGCYHSRLQAGKSVTINGVFRGGEIQAQGDVYIRELGSRSGTETRVITRSGAKVKAGHVFENTSVQIGPRVYSFGREEQGVTLYLDREGELIRSYMN
ncbi:septum site-determining protein MinC [Moorella thermoacetica]|nr:septum site-determining protein MinC [Moorella thermoacetica]